MAERRLRVATFNASLNRDRAGELVQDLGRPDDPQARQVAAIIQAVDPDILLLNEFDHDPAGEAAALFRANYLAVAQDGGAPVDYPHWLAPPVNTGAPTGFDLDRDGRAGGPGDAQGFGRFEGQYGLLVLSKLPIRLEEVRTFRTFLWQDMPGALLPAGWYPPEALARLRLSSKTHVDVPVEVGGGALHLLASHPTPPVFDGPEDRNGRRNHDEIRLFADYADPDRSAYLVDDRGGAGGLPAGARFVVLGDLNADPLDGDSTAGAAAQLTQHPLIDAGLVPTAEGGREAAARQGRANRDHAGDPAADTADFGEPPGNLRVDYVLPSKAGLQPVGAGIFWPPKGATGAALAGASDHHLTWIDLELVPGPQGALGGTACTVGVPEPVPGIDAPGC
jgi:endonuclease/exonuclease/phosphatase family metal-dependent hydrolase